jgi:LmbE family N-acetylglucosaminyl deacetylase
VAAHPDDEYVVAATTDRLTRELGWAADHVVITNGEAGYRYSALAEAVYGVGLTGESEGRSRLPAIRRRETLAAGKVLGIRRHYFLDQRDSGFATDAANAPTSNWDHAAVLGFLTGQWDCTVTVNGTDIPFRMEFSADGAVVKGNFFNGDERVPSTSGQLQEGSLRLNFDQYANRLSATVS